MLFKKMIRQSGAEDTAENVEQSSELSVFSLKVSRKARMQAEFFLTVFLLQ